MRALQYVVLATVVFTGVANAESFKNITKAFDVEDMDRLRLEVSIGELEIETWDGDEIQLDIELTAERNWFLWRRGNVDEIDLEVKENGSELLLRIEEKNINQHWVVKVPATLALEVEMGVGEVNVEELSNSLLLELGVGEVQVRAGEMDFDYVQASVGVGDATLRGFGRGSENERSFVSADAYYEGEGEHFINIDLGVGEVSVRR